MRTAPAEAIGETERLVEAFPDAGEALAAPGCALAGVCRWDEALPWLDRAIAAAPGDARLPIRRDQIIAARDAAQGAMKRLREDLESQPRDADRWRELGLGLAKFARLEEALQAFDRAHEIAPIDPDAEQPPLVVAALMVEATARSYLLVGQIAPIG
jgi:tetratricopeptide (TPR) repeat protein